MPATSDTAFHEKTGLTSLVTSLPIGLIKVGASGDVKSTKNLQGILCSPHTSLLALARTVQK